MAFKIGQRVRLKRTISDVPFNSLGTVIEDDPVPWVVLDKRRPSGNDVSEDLPGWRAGHMAAFPRGNWEPCDDSVRQLAPWVTVESCIATYAAACEQFEAAELALEKAKAAVQDARLNLRDALDGET